MATWPVSVNLIALPTRLVRTWRMRPASPTKCRGTSGAYRTSSSSPFSRAWDPSRLATSLATAPKSKTTGREDHLAGFDLREVQDVVDDGQEACRRVAHRLRIAHLLGREVRIEQQARHPDHAVHGSPDLVAHAGQEVALRPAGGLGRLLEPLLGGELPLDDPGLGADLGAQHHDPRETGQDQAAHGEERRQGPRRRPPGCAREQGHVPGRAQYQAERLDPRPRGSGKDLGSRLDHADAGQPEQASRAQGREARLVVRALQHGVERVSARLHA